MSVASKLKAAEKQEICKQIVTVLKKRYSDQVPANDRPVLETILFAICLENMTLEEAEIATERLEQQFQGLNDLRVSSITELMTAFEGLREAEWKALRIRATIQHIFEKNFDFQFEGIRRKTLDSATNDLNEIPHLTDYVRSYTLQTILGSHLIPVDQISHGLFYWLGLVDREWTFEDVAAAIKPAVRKADAPLFCYLTHSLATDPEYRDEFEEALNAELEEEDESPWDPDTGVKRLKQLLGLIKDTSKKKSPPKKATTAKPSTAKKTTAKKTTSKKTATKKATAKKKTTAKKTASKKKTTAKKTATKKATAKKTTGKKTTASAKKKSSTKKQKKASSKS